VLAACALAAGVFILTPRGIGSDLLGALGKPQRTEIGFNDDGRLGASGFLNESQVPVMDLALFDSDGRNVGDASRPVYLRGAVRDLYNARGRWMSSNESGVPGEEVGLHSRLEISPIGSEASLLIQRITPRSTRADSDDYVFHVWRPVWLVPSGTSKIRLSSSDYTMRLPGGTRSAGRGTYEVASSLTDLNMVGYLPLVPDTFQQGPIADLTRQVLADASGPGQGSGSDDMTDAVRLRRDATRIRDYLQRTYSYTLEMVAPAEGQDPIEMFLFDTKRGHCEYFASAMVAMCQSAGIPARLVLGYVATDFNSFTGQYTVRESNAHAWAEVSVGEGRWVTLDPSPPADIERIHKPPTGLFSRLRALYDLIEFNWNESIVGFDSTRQRRMLGVEQQNRGWGGNLLNQIDSLWKSAVGLLGVPEDMRLGAEFFRVLVWWIGLALLITLVIWLAWRKRRTILFRRLAHGDLDPELRTLLTQAAFYRRALKSLRRAGTDKPRSRSPIDHAAILAAHNPKLAAAFDRLARHYYTLRFARRKLSDAEVSDAAAALQQLDTLAAAQRGISTPVHTVMR
jgi:transglutaminase-like putative cysteine protease